MRNEDNPQIQQTSLAELHRLSVSLSNLYDVAPTIVGVGKDATISITPETKSSTTANEIHRLVFLSSEVFCSGYGIKKSIRGTHTELTVGAVSITSVGLPTNDKREITYF